MRILLTVVLLVCSCLTAPAVAQKKKAAGKKAAAKKAKTKKKATKKKAPKKAPQLKPGAVSFRKSIATLLLDNCFACHGPKKAEGGYRVDTYERLLKEGDSGSHGIVAKKLDESELYRRIVSNDPDERMPLDSEPLSPQQIALIKKWIAEGAVFDGTNPKAELATIVPPPTHPKAPSKYPNTLPITAMTFSKDGKELFVAGYHEITSWNPANGKLGRRITNVGQRTYAMELNPAGTILAVGGGAPGRHGETRLFDVKSGKLLRVLGSTSDVVLDLAFTPKGDRLAAGSADGVIRVFEVASGKEQMQITSHSDWVMAVAWNKDATRLVSGSRDKTAKVFDAKKGELIVTYSGHGQPVKGVVFHPDGKEVFSSGNDNKLHRWNAANGKRAAQISFGGGVFKLNVNGGFLFASSADKTVRQFDAKTHKAVRSYAGNTDWALCTSFHAGSKRVASGGFDGSVYIWNAADGKVTAKFVAAPGYVKK